MWIGVCLATACPSGQLAAREAEGGVTESQATLEVVKSAYDKYFELKKLISKEKGEWELEEEILKDRTQLVVDQIKELEGKIAEEEEKITEADTEREELQEQLEELQKVEGMQKEKIAALERRMKVLVPMLPETLRAKVQPLIERLPKEDTAEEDIKLSVSQRFGNVLGILNEVNKFHADLSGVNERRTVEGGRQAEVRTLYLGVSSAYYAGSGETAGEAGVGMPSGDGWEWSKLPEFSQEIGRLIRIYDNEDVAAFVPLPIDIKEDEQ